MKIRTEGKCIGCKERYACSKGSAHLLKCEGVLQSLRSQKKLEEGYLVRISWAEEPNMYWMVVAVANGVRGHLKGTTCGRLKRDHFKVA